MPHSKAAAPKPRPTKLVSVLKADADISLFRNLHCRHYGGCIDVVVKKGWQSFTCARCPYFHDEQAPHASEHAYDQPSDMGKVLPG